LISTPTTVASAVPGSNPNNTILEQFQLLRFMDENIYLRSGSLNIFNGMVGLNFSCDGSHYMSYREFLEKDIQF
jgi:hypothetical protein